MTTEQFGRMTDRELLVAVATDLSLIKRAVFGDGRPGLVEAVTANNEQIKALVTESARRVPYFDGYIALREQVQDLDQRTLSRAERRGLFTTLGSVTLMALAALVKAFVGFHHN